MPPSSDNVSPLRITPSIAATLACIWEASAAKPGNVHRGSDFSDLTYMDLVTSASIIGPVVGQASDRGVGQTVLDGVRATQSSVATNANLGILLLLAPLAVAHQCGTIQDSITDVLEKLTTNDAEAAYAAIRLARPGGLGTAKQADVNDSNSPSITLTAAMELAADHDLIARQYVCNFIDVFETTARIEQGIATGWAMADSIVRAFLQLNAKRPDTLIVRKCGSQFANEVAAKSAAVINSGLPGEPQYQEALADLDFFLRADGNQRNPGASADVIAAALFVLILEQRVHWPVRFYATPT